jgi:cell envelope opacity-associated protein A
MPSHWKAMPPSSGPIMRVAALVAESRAMAGTMRWGPATSPTMRRRVDISVAHMVPDMRLPSATCHRPSCPVVASVASTVETIAGTSSASMTMVLRLTASDTAPAKAPNSSCGSWRAATTAVAASADPVTW